MCTHKLWILAMVAAVLVAGGAGCKKDAAVATDEKPYLITPDTGPLNGQLPGSSNCTTKGAVGAMGLILKSDCADVAKVPVCGDNVKDTSEQCDDGNTTNGDGCSATCTLEGVKKIDDGTTGKVVCGNGTKEKGEECDDGNTVSYDGCSSKCNSESLTITTTSLTEGEKGAAYNVSPIQAKWSDASTCKKGQCQFSVTSGSLPPGIAFSADGKLTGTPTTAGTYAFDVSVSSQNALVISSIKSFTLLVKQVRIQVKVDGFAEIKDDNGDDNLNEKDTGDKNPNAYSTDDQQSLGGIAASDGALWVIPNYPGSPGTLQFSVPDATSDSLTWDVTVDGKTDSSIKSWNYLTGFFVSPVDNGTPKDVTYSNIVVSAKRQGAVVATMTIKQAHFVAYTPVPGYCELYPKPVVTAKIGDKVLDFAKDYEVTLGKKVTIDVSVKAFTGTPPTLTVSSSAGNGIAGGFSFVGSNKWDVTKSNDKGTNYTLTRTMTYTEPLAKNYTDIPVSPSGVTENVNLEVSDQCGKSTQFLTLKVKYPNLADELDAKFENDSVFQATVGMWIKDHKGGDTIRVELVDNLQHLIAASPETHVSDWGGENNQSHSVNLYKCDDSNLGGYGSNNCSTVADPMAQAHYRIGVPNAHDCASCSDLQIAVHNLLIMGKYHYMTWTDNGVGKPFEFDGAYVEGTTYHFFGDSGEKASWHNMCQPIYDTKLDNFMTECLQGPKVSIPPAPAEGKAKGFKGLKPMSEIKQKPGQ